MFDIGLNILLLFIISLGNLILAFVVYQQGKSKLSNRLFFMVAISLSLWVVIGPVRYLYYSYVGGAVAPFILTKLSFIFAVSTFYFFLLFIYSFPEDKFKLKKKLFYLYSSLYLLVIGLSFVPNAIQDSEEFVLTSIHPVMYFGTAYYYLYIPVLCLFFIIGIYRLIKTYISLKKGSLEKKQVGFILLAFSLAGMLGLFFGLFVAIFPPLVNLFWLGRLSTLIFVALTSYAILKHHLFNVKIIATELFVFSLWTVLIIRAALANTLQDFLISGIILLTTVLIGVFLIQSVTREIKQREELENLTNKLEKANLKLKEMDKIKTENLRLASQEAQQEKEKTLAVFNNFSDALLFFNKDHILSLANPRAEKMLNIKAKDLIGKSPHEIKEINNILNQTIEITGEEVKEVFREEISPEENIYMEITSITIHREDEQMGYLIIIHDITREKNVDHMKTDFVSLAAHQLRTPLTGVKWALRNLLGDKEEFEISEDAATFLEKSYDANEKMITLVDDLLDVTRIEEGRYVYEKERINSKDLLDTIVKDRRELIEKKGLKFNTEIPDDLPDIEVDKNRFTLVVQNLLDNALKYTDEGEITLKAETIEDNRLKISLSDTGVGIPLKQQEEMFRKFSRADNVKHMDTEGFGLGLFISKNIIEAHGGEISYQSKEGEGSVFWITVPGI